MSKLHCISVPKYLLDKGPEDLAEQIENKAKVKLRDMSAEAQEVFRQCWDPEVDGHPWPPPFDHVLLGFVEDA